MTRTTVLRLFSLVLKGSVNKEKSGTLRPVEKVAKENKKKIPTITTWEIVNRDDIFKTAELLGEGMSMHGPQLS